MTHDITFLHAGRNYRSSCRRLIEAVEGSLLKEGVTYLTRQCSLANCKHVGNCNRATFDFK